MASPTLQIPVRAWNPPIVADAPPSDSTTGDWYTDRYVGVADTALDLEAETAELDSGLTVTEYQWFDSVNNLIATQTPGQTASYTWGGQNLSGSVKVKAITDLGIESDEQSFSLKIYPTLQIQTDGPFVGSPNSLVTLSGSANEAGYPGATISYQWAVQKIHWCQR
ncbi:hypothetical protein IH992_29825 [Candidatus Poribacteria bacterium]|nr:hypothetical protein [Candidatus Poribacteria bacterium]